MLQPSGQECAMEAQETTAASRWSYLCSTFFSFLTSFFVVLDWVIRKPRATEHSIVLLLIVFGCWFCYHRLQSGLCRVSQCADSSEMKRLFDAAEGLLFLANSLILGFCIHY